MCVNNLPKVATRWNSGATRDSNRGRRVLIPSHHRATQKATEWKMLCALIVTSSTSVH